jgi:hypothetical protein
MTFYLDGDMQNELLLHDEPATPVVATTPMAMLSNWLAGGGDIDKAGQLLDLCERYERTQAAAAYNAAIARFQSLCPVVPKGRSVQGMGYSYADYGDVMKVAKPHLDACGLAVSFSTETIDGGLRVTCRISHGSHHEDHLFTVPIPSTLRVNDAQKFGAALSFAKRYALTAALNIVCSDDVDDDGAGLCEQISEKQAVQISELLMTTNSDTARFLKWAGVASIYDLSIARYREAVLMLEAKPKA